jgi:hypothetical protein
MVPDASQGLHSRMWEAKPCYCKAIRAARTPSYCPFLSLENTLQPAGIRRVTKPLTQPSMQSWQWEPLWLSHRALATGLLFVVPLPLLSEWIGLFCLPCAQVRALTRPSVEGSGALEVSTWKARI